MPTASEIQAVQGTRLSEKAPWETYNTEMETKMSPALAAAVAEYAERSYESDQTSNQNKEALAEEKELSESVASQYQWVTPEEYADVEARIGLVRSHEEVITLLRKAGVCCHYRQHVHPDKAVLWVSRGGGLQEAENACWVQIGQMPELTIMGFDEHGAPLAERRRGWRTVLLQLILKGYISEEKANKVFGKPKHHKEFDRYNSLLQSFRNAGNSLAKD